MDNSKPPKTPPSTENPPNQNNFGKNEVNSEEKPINPEETPKNDVRGTVTERNRTKTKEKKLKDKNYLKIIYKNDSEAINAFVDQFKEFFCPTFSQDNINSFRRYILERMDSIKGEYSSVDIFLKSVFRRMLDLNEQKHIDNPTSYLIAGLFTGRVKFLWQLTHQEERKTATGYHKQMMKQLELGKENFIGLKEM